MTGEQIDLPRGFFEREPDAVAKDLIGAEMVVRSHDHVVAVKIVETEAYGGEDDPASHAFRGETPRCAVMFGPAGHLYVYRSYGVHWCMNVVTQPAGVASAVLLRGAEQVSDSRSHGFESTTALLRGPGNLTRALGITGTDNAQDCCRGVAGRLSFIAARDGDEDLIGSSVRIGISKARERRSRYFLLGSRAVSRSPQ